jgi:hypothetical protein
MTKPLTSIVDFIRTQREQDALEQAAIDYLANIERMYAQVGAHMENNAALCRKYGRAALLAKLPPELAALGEAVTEGVRQAWTQLSDTDFPAMPDQPVQE